MSIEITGPERYEFQYHVTLELILRLWHQGVTAIVDSGGEDATLEVDVDVAAGGSRVPLELQVKGSEDPKNAVDESLLCEYLAHFPSRQSSGSLLERLLTRTDGAVLLVCAQRAKDFCSPLTVRQDWRGTPHPKAPLSASAAKAFLAKAASWSPTGDSPLMQQRKATFSFMASATTHASLNEAFKRLAIQDLVSKEVVMRRTDDHLRVLGVPGDRIERASLRMLQSVRDSKGTGNDVAVEIRRILEDETVRSIRPSDYVPRGDEESWRNALSVNRALLLSGPPRCGKTGAALWIAAELQLVGYDVRRLSLVDEAERALLDKGRADIAVVLDDPLGSDFEVNSHAGRALVTLDRLIRNLPANRRLIVAQSQEVLFAAKNAQTVAAMTTGNLTWEDLGKVPPGFLSKVWDEQARSNQVSGPVRQAIAEAIAKGEIDFPAGVLAHLASQHLQMTGSDVVRQAMSLASQSAEDFAMTLCYGVGQDVVRALAIGSTPVETSADRELAFILGEGSELKIPSPPYFTIVSSDTEDEPAVAPTYAKQPTLPKSARQELIKLQRHRVLLRKAQDQFQFAHPFYRAAARSVVRRAVSMERDDVLTAVRRGLFAPSLATSAATARNLWWLHQDLSDSLGLGDALVDLADRGLHWHYPTTRDLCYSFLLDLVRLKPQLYEDKLESWVKGMMRIELEDAVWDGAEPFFPDETSRSMLSYFEPSPKANKTRALQAAAKLRAGDALPSASEAVETLRYFKAHPDELDVNVALRLLAFGEGLIRAEAAYAWLKVQRQGDDEVLDRLKHEVHPSVVSRTLDATVKAWPHCEHERRLQLIATLRGFNAQPETAAVIVLGLLGHFTAEDDFRLRDQSSKPWELVGEVLAPALKAYPNSFRMAGTRLYEVCSTALELLPASPAAALANGWVDWLELRISDGQLPDDYMLGPVGALIGAPAISEDERRKVIQRLLSLQSTGAVLVFVANLVAKWGRLTDSEKAVVLDVLSGNRRDQAWLHAAALTQSKVPSEVQLIVLGKSDAFEKSGAELVALLSPVLLTTCVFMHRGSPQPLWFLGHHHDHSSQWREVVLHLASTPDHPLFEECLDELFSFGDDYGAEAFSQVAERVGVSGRRRLFNHLLEWKTGVVGEWHQQEFDHLLDLAVDDIARQEMLARMVEESPKIIEELSDILQWTNRRDLQDALLKKFDSDFQLVKLWSTYKKLDIDLTKIGEDAGEILVSLAELQRPMLPKTCWMLEEWLGSLSASEDLKLRAKNVREAVIESFGARKGAHEGTGPTRFLDWIGPN